MTTALGVQVIKNCHHSCLQWHVSEGAKALIKTPLPSFAASVTTQEASLTFIIYVSPLLRSRLVRLVMLFYIIAAYIANRKNFCVPT